MFTKTLDLLKQLVLFLDYVARGIIYNCNMFIVQASGLALNAMAYAETIFF
jgi:hypothetical protein